MFDPTPEMLARLSNDPYEVHGMQAGFQLPRGIWRSMFALYAIFFLGIAAATDFAREPEGGSRAGGIAQHGGAFLGRMQFFGARQLGRVERYRHETAFAIDEAVAVRRAGRIEDEGG